VILTGKGDPIDRAIGLEIGADDYVAKPFHLRELLARVRSVLRRTKTRPGRKGGAVTPVIRFAGWRFDLAKRTLTSAQGKSVPLTTAEFQLLEAFVSHPNQVLGRDQLLQLVARRRWSSPLQMQTLPVVAGCITIWLISATPSQVGRSSEHWCDQAAGLSYCLYPGRSPRGAHRRSVCYPLLLEGRRHSSRA
jgi:hypothetical protein